MSSASDPIASPEGLGDAEIDRLFSLPLGEFIAARDELAKRLRKEDREAAAWVKGLRKPSVAAWATNQLVRAQPKKTKRLFKAAEALQGAQEEVARGSGDGAELRCRTDEERQAVSALVDEAKKLQEGLSDAVVDRMRDTLHAVASDQPARQLVEKARLTQDLRATGFGPMLPAAGAHGTKTRDKRRAEPSKADDKKRAKAEKQLDAAQGKVEDGKRLLQAARRAVREATAERDRAQKQLDTATTKERRAGEELAKAQGRAGEAERRLRAAS